jgi:TatD DNase family protein
MQLHDTHVHLESLVERLNLQPDQVESEIQKLLENHRFVIHSTVSTDNYIKSFNLFSNQKKVYYILGSHPDLVMQKGGFDLKTYLDNQTKFLSDIDSLQVKSITGIGEIGLDYYYTKDTKLQELQKELFKTQIELALQMELPIVIHCREAFDDLFKILDLYPEIYGRFLIHCFTGTGNDLHKILDRKGNIALGGISTYDTADHLKEVIKNCPLEYLMLETDLPYLSPAHKRGKICLPEYIKITADFIGKIKDVPTEQIFASSFHSCLQIFPKIKQHFAVDDYKYEGNK